MSIPPNSATRESRRVSIPLSRPVSIWDGDAFFNQHDIEGDVVAEMNCPRCQAPMENGPVELKAWGIGAFPQAQLHFGNDLLLKDQYWPFVGLFRKGTTANAFRCKACKLVCFEYGK